MYLNQFGYYAYALFKMDDLLEYYSHTSLIKMLCKHRARLSHKRHKKHMIRDISLHERTNNIQIAESDKEFQFLQSIFPSRRNWKKLNQHERLNSSRFSNSIERNQHRLWKSYKFEHYQVENKSKSPEEWYLNLLDFCDCIREKINFVESNGYKISKPEIIPLPKSYKKRKYVYRPIAKYSLIDKIITSTFSRYLTVKFDDVFLDCSYAFRARKDEKIPNHHDSIIRILKHRKRKPKLWVSECDIQKFFDTVQHLHLETVFNYYIKKLEKEGKSISPKAIRLFYLFLDSYSFNKDVLVKNLQPDYFKSKGVPIGQFGWVESELNAYFGNDYSINHKIGIPQGNAVSCFISNLILSKIDEEVVAVDKDLLYVRYCDDMVLAHTKERVCKKALEIYKKGIKENFLLYHPTKQFENYKDSSTEFWLEKSKEPYYWGNKYVHLRNVPWLSFVGYQINYKGEIRVRKVSIKKEIKKQIQEAQRILLAIGMNSNREMPEINKFSRKSKRQIVFSLEQRLISMSVGRVTMFNYDSKDDIQGLCWTNGFKLLSNNKIAVKQLKELDKRREQQIQYIKRYIKLLSKKSEQIDELPKHLDDIYFGKPFSYFQHLAGH